MVRRMSQSLINHTLATVDINEQLDKGGKFLVIGVDYREVPVVESHALQPVPITRHVNNHSSLNSCEKRLCRQICQKE